MIKEEFELTFQEVTTKNKLFCQFDDHYGVLLLDVKNSFTADDFNNILTLIEPYLAKRGELRGIIIHSKKFPYWSGARNRREYVDFALENHHKFRKAALSMGGFFPKILAKIAKGRVHPEVKIFKHNRIGEAQEWILDD
ncbi:MAG: STAS/SEC14 domain-containing protein [Proteobacteria bacterium]|nr:STAS/SEC14 domain-containing protein [Pseudomonadota bacterium]